MLKNAILIVPAALRLLALPGAAEAQAPHVTSAQQALEACAVRGAPKSAADGAEQRFRALLRSDATNIHARVGLAQVLVRCQTQHAGVTGIMTVVGEAEANLQQVLAAEPAHWEARFTLAMLLRNLPPMLGRANDAIREFERLLAVQARSADSPVYAQPFIQLGELYDAAGRRAAAVDVWRRGLALFPAHETLRERLLATADAAVPDSAWLRTAAGDTPAADVATSPDTPQVFVFAPLVVEALNHQFQDARSGTTLRRLDVYTMPGGTGEMLQALQALPGATRAGDGAELYIRGGDPAETPVFFDGGRLAFPGRWESLQGSAMGVVDAAVLRRAYFSSGGFSARYGNALSGVVDVETEGRPARSTSRFGANMVQAGGSLRTALGERTGLWATASATDTRLITHMHGNSDVFTRAPQSAQAIGGVAYEPAPGVELRTTLLTVADRYGRRVEMNGHAGEYASSSAMQHMAVSGRAVRADGRRGVSGSVTGSWRRNAMSFGVLDRERTDGAVGGRLHGDVALASGLRVRSGLEALHYDAGSTGRVPATPSLAPGAPVFELPDEHATASHAGAYLEAEHAPAPGFSIVSGLRVDALPGGSTALDPRVAAAYTAGDWTVRAGGGVFHQGPWRARYRLPDPGQPSGTAQRAEHVVIGAERTGTLALRMEAYLKRYGDYAPAGEGPAVTAGTNAGLDAIARWTPRSGPSGWLSYSLLRTRVELEDGTHAPAALDATHSVTAVTRMPVGEQWELGATGRYASGRPFTPATYDATAGRLTYGAVHSERMPSYQRLDARITRYFLGNTQRTALMYLEMLNLLDRRNVMSYTWNENGARVPIETVFAHRTFVLGVELQFN